MVYTQMRTHTFVLVLSYICGFVALLDKIQSSFSIFTVNTWRQHIYERCLVTSHILRHVARIRIASGAHGFKVPAQTYVLGKFHGEEQRVNAMRLS